MELQGKTVSWMARRLSCCRTNVYKIYEKKSIDMDLLMRISYLLDYNFFSVYSEEWKKSVPNK